MAWVDSMSQIQRELYEFSDFHLDVPERLLTQEGKRIPLPEKAFETLRVLVQEAGHLVTKKELLSQVWAGTFVEENSLDKSVSLLRQVLGERNGKAKFIETVRGHGYRFVADVKKLPLPESETDSIKPADATEDMQPPVQRLSTAFGFAVKPKKVSTLWIGLALIGIVVSIAVAWKWIGLKNLKATEASLHKIQSLAVLPLKNLSGDASQDYLADGMTEELITKLAQISSLRVISRTSVMEYKRAQKSLPEIARELKVDAILEGSVLQVGKRLRVTAQLIRADTDHHLWADSYEHDFEDILALQNEVAVAIASEVQIAVTPEESARFKKASRVNPEAYQAYLRGLYYSDRELTSENLQMAAEMFQKSVHLDPKFASAIAQLSKAEVLLYFHQDRSSDRLSKSKALIDKAFGLQPGFAEAHLALGCYYYWGLQDYDRALEQLKIAEQDLPNHKMILALQAGIYRRQGQWLKALEAQKKVVELNPRHAFTMFNAGYNSFLMRRYSEADQYFNRCISLGPDEQNGYVGTALNLVYWKGDVKTAKQILNKTAIKNNDRFITHRFWLELLDRKYAEALNVLSSPHAEPIEKHVYSGLVYRLSNEQNLARRSFRTAIQQIQKELHRESPEFSIHGMYGLALAGLGQKQRAIEEGKHAVQLMPVSKDATLGPNRLETLAVIYVMTGESEAALDQLEYLLSIPSRFSVEMLKLDPMWDPIRTQPRFRKLLGTQQRSEMKLATDEHR